MSAMKAPCPAPPASDPKWARGLQPQGRGWALGFQIKGKRSQMTVYCSQEEAAVAYDLASVWAAVQKGAVPERCTYTNFRIYWYPAEFIARMKALHSWAEVKTEVEALVFDGTARLLVPFFGAGPRHDLTSTDAWEPRPRQQLCINARGLHLFTGDAWRCIAMEDVASFEGSGDSLQLNYRTVGIAADRARTTVQMQRHSFVSAQVPAILAELRSACAVRQAAGEAHVPTDLGAASTVPAVECESQEAGDGGELTSQQARQQQHIAGPTAGGSLEQGKSEEAEEEEGPSLEDLELLSGFAAVAASSLGSGEAVAPFSQQCQQAQERGKVVKRKASPAEVASNGTAGGTTASGASAGRQPRRAGRQRASAGDDASTLSRAGSHPVHGAPLAAVKKDQEGSGTIATGGMEEQPADRLELVAAAHMQAQQAALMQQLQYAQQQHMMALAAVNAQAQLARQGGALAMAGGGVVEQAAHLGGAGLPLAAFVPAAPQVAAPDPTRGAAPGQQEALARVQAEMMQALAMGAAGAGAPFPLFTMPAQQQAAGGAADQGQQQLLRLMLAMMSGGVVTQGNGGK